LIAHEVMIRQDYIMRMIEQLVKVLSKILLNKETGDYESAVRTTDHALKSIVGIDFSLIDKLSAGDIKLLFEMTKDNSTTGIKCIVTAKLIKEKADILKLKNNNYSKQVSNYQKALSLFLDGIIDNKNTEIDLSKFYPDINEIVKFLADEIANDTKTKLLKFYELN
ncbi:MAG: DUF6483 family protein, partial [Ignavibacteriaceae bacterium]